ncbi:MAG: hypothetical protein FJ265_07000 [Planctomycetes bacterium]|nr:hypothetical protein [Planctomycetota bacterium]
MARQRNFFHKCHRCVFRGKPADWLLEPAAEVVRLSATAETPESSSVRKVELQAMRGNRRRRDAIGPKAAKSAEAGA